MSGAADLVAGQYSAPLGAREAPSSTLEHALDLARRGFWLFPVRPGGKLPARRGWQDSATRDEATITKWFSSPRAYNVGISTSRFQEDKALAVVDLDTKNGKRGDESLLALELGGFDLPPTLEHRTGSGGKHFIFVCDEPLRQGVDVLGSGLDIRSRGGLIVAPGSLVDGKPYVRLNNLEPAPAPEWLVQRLGVDRGRAPVDPAPLAGVDPAKARARGVEIATAAAPALAGQGGDTVTYKLFAQLKDTGCTQEEAVDIVLEHWNDRCEPPWTLDELGRLADHAYRYGREQPGISAPEAVFDPVEDDEGAPAKAKPRALDVLRWSDFKGKVVPPVKWIWEPYFPATPFGILASHPGHGKSFLALQMAVAVATGLPLLGLPTGAPAGAGVLALEDDANVIHRRLRAIVESYGLTWTPEHDALLQSNLVVIVRGRTALEGTEGNAAAHQLNRLAKELVEAMGATQAPPAVLFLDTLNAIHGGDENSNAEVRPLVATIFGLHDTLGCSVWALHHLRKSGTGRNAPALTDRLDPELVRGAGALVGSARAVVQFGWITPSEATRAGLEAENSHRRYAVMGLTKINDGPQSPWTLLEHAPGSGLWVPTAEGDRALAALRGGGAVEELGKAEAVLLDLHKGMDRAALAAKHFPDDPKGTRMKGALAHMRTRQGWLEKGSITLTTAGLKKALELKGSQSAEGGYLDDPGIEESQ